MRAVWILVISFASAVAAFSAGAMGHNALGSATVDRILNGTYPAPPELKEALKDPQVRQAFLGGAVGPDLFPTKTHRGNQSLFTQKMIDSAWKEFRAAPNDPAAKEKAAQSLAFAYGWLSHVAIDLNVHPKVNEIIGDAYDHNNAGEKTTHAAMEAQLYAYLQRVAGLNAQFDARFPSDFISEQLGIDPGELKRAISRIRIIAAGEIASAKQVTLTNTQLKEMWSKSVQQGMSDAREYIEKPTRFENWDLDCGKLSTEEFEWLRSAIMALNGGKLPSDWGRNYLRYWSAVKGLPPGDRANKLAAIFGKNVAETPTNAGVPGIAKLLASKRMNLIVKVEREWGYPTTMGAYPDAQIRWDGAKFSWNKVFEDYPYTKDIRIEGEMGEGEVAWIKLSCSQTMKDNPGAHFSQNLEARHIPFIDGGLWDEYVGDVTFAAFTEKQASGFSGSFKASSGTNYVWDKTTMPEFSKGRTLYPILTVRFREKK